MKMINTAAVVLVSLMASGCASNTPPLCYNEAVVMKKRVSVPVFGIRKPVSTTEYLSGGSFGYQWVERSAFTDASACDRLPVTE
ncbi:phage exclusion lipoprotein Cor [Kosakonia cowanii]|uniref:phage exclusion lipoprotein Cor n=1 Tax=Kosakonia cowanii TaxID=208223 RepID=UPI002FDE10C5